MHTIRVYINTEYNTSHRKNGSSPAASLQLTRATGSQSKEFSDFFPAARRRSALPRWLNVMNSSRLSNTSKDLSETISVTLAGRNVPAQPTAPNNDRKNATNISTFTSKGMVVAILKFPNFFITLLSRYKTPRAQTKSTRTKPGLVMCAQQAERNDA